jgi:glycosyltransferase involved in cell wall biosynthesis
MRVIRVLHVIDSLGSGGTEYQLTAMLARADARRFEHVVCALGTADVYSHRLRAAGVRVERLGRTPRREPVRTLRALRAALRDVAPHLVHASLYWSGVLGRIAAGLAGIPAVTSLVNTTYEPEWRLDNPRLTPFKVAVVQAADGLTARAWGTWFVAVTEAVKASAVKHLRLPPELVSVIPRGLEMERFAPPPRPRVAALRGELGWDGAYPVMVNVGRLVPQKGQRYAIEAMPEILKVQPRALLALVGKGPLHQELGELARALGVERRVQLLGMRQDVPMLLAAADLFVFPSLFEGFGGAMVEALAAGCPCVGSRIAPLLEVSNGGRVARLVEPGSPRAIAHAVTELAGDLVGASRLGDEAAAWARERYEMSASTRAFEAVFAAVAAGRPADPERTPVAVG